MSFETAVAFAIAMILIIVANWVGRAHRARRQRQINQFKNKIGRRKS